MPIRSGARDIRSPFPRMVLVRLRGGGSGLADRCRTRSVALALVVVLGCRLSLSHNIVVPRTDFRRASATSARSITAL